MKILDYLFFFFGSSYKKKYENIFLEKFIIIENYKINN